MLSGIYRTVLATSTAKAYHQVGEVALLVSLYRLVDHGIDMNEPLVDGALLLEELDYVIVEAGEGFVLVILARVVKCAAVKYIATAVARWVVGNAFLVGKAHYSHGERFLLAGEVFHVH